MKAAIAAVLCIWSAASLAVAQPIDPLWGDPIVIDPAKPPEGMQIVHLLLSNASTPLKGTGCSDPSAPDRALTLREQLAVVLGQAIGAPKGHKAHITGQCRADKTDALGGVVNVWSCEINVEHVDEKGEYVANGSIGAHFTRDTWTMIPQSLICL